MPRYEVRQDCGALRTAGLDLQPVGLRARRPGVAGDLRCRLTAEPSLVDGFAGAVLGGHTEALARGCQSPFFYTLDLLLPVFSYGQQSQFAPTGAYQWFSYALITAGWILATTIITGINRALYRN